MATHVWCRYCVKFRYALAWLVSRMSCVSRHSKCVTKDARKVCLLMKVYIHNSLNNPNVEINLYHFITAPEEPPRDVNCRVVGSSSIFVSWKVSSNCKSS